MLPKTYNFLRLNFVRNMQYPPDDRNTGWFLTTGAHSSPLSRGYLIFE